jgi:hypothetical protein
MQQKMLVLQKRDDWQTAGGDLSAADLKQQATKSAEEGG